MKYKVSVCQWNKSGSNVSICLRIVFNKKRYLKTLFNIEQKFWDNAKSKIRQNHLHCIKLNLQIESEIAKAINYFLDSERNKTEIDVSSFLKVEEVKQSMYTSVFIATLQDCKKIFEYFKESFLLQSKFNIA
jgi:hypothetical protein